MSGQYYHYTDPHPAAAARPPPYLDLGHMHHSSPSERSHLYLLLRAQAPPPLFSPPVRPCAWIFLCALPSSPSSWCVREAAGAKQVAASAVWLKTGSAGWFARAPAAAIQPSAHLVLAGGQSWPGAGHRSPHLAAAGGWAGEPLGTRRQVASS